MAFFTTECVETLEDVIQGIIDKVQFELNNEWFDCEILKRGIDGDFRCIVCDIPTSASGTITGICAIDENGTVIGVESENIVKAANYAYCFALKYKITNENI